MAELDENIEQDDEVASPPTDEDVVAAVSYLADAFDKILEVDKSKLTKVGVARLNRMKRQVFNSMMYYCDLLPQPDEKPKPEAEDEEE